MALVAKQRDPGSEDIKVRLLEAGERLIAELGIHGASLRQVAREAGSANTNAVRYHFGGLAGLLKEIVRYRSHQLETVRSQMLTRLAAEGRLTDGRALIEAFLRPIADLTGPERTRHYASFLLTLEQANQLAGLGEKGPVSQEVVRHLRAALPGVSEKHFSTWLRFAGLMFVCGIVSLDNARQRRELRLTDEEEVICNLLDMAFGSLAGPPTATSVAA